MRWRTVCIYLYYGLGGIYWLFVLGLVTIAALQGVDKDWLNTWSPNLARRLPSFQFQAHWLVPTLLAALASAEAVRRYIRSPREWRTIQNILDVFQAYIFGSEGDALYDHRVTLFQYKRWRWCLHRWPYSKWLVPVARSGSEGCGSSVFWVPNEDKAEGVAGMAHVKWVVTPVIDLPELTRDSHRLQKQQYVEDSYISRRWVEERIRTNKLLPRSICGIPVRVKQKPWGVIVIDSSNPQAIGVSEADIKVYNMIGLVMGQLLEGQ